MRRTILILSLAAHAIVAACALRQSAEPAPDFDRYYAIASSTGRPYVDYQVEHPIGTLLVFKALALAPGGRASFGPGVVALNVAVDALIVGSLWAVWGMTAAAYYALVALPIVDLLFNRIDLWSMAAATVALAAWRRERQVAAAVALAAGVSLKLWPLPFVVALLAPRPASRRSIAPIATFAAIAGLLGCVAWWLAGSRSIVEVLTFRGAHGWQIESFVGSVIHLVDPASLKLERGAWRIGATGGTMAIGLFAAAMPIALWSAWRGFRAQRPGLAWLASVSALLCASALFSAQYAGWLVPGGAIAWAERRNAALKSCATSKAAVAAQDFSPAFAAWLVAAVVVLTAVFWRTYDLLLAGNTLVMLVVVARNAMVLLLAIESNLQPKLTSERVVERSERG